MNSLSPNGPNNSFPREDIHPAVLFCFTPQSSMTDTCMNDPTNYKNNRS